MSFIKKTARGHVDDVLLEEMGDISKKRVLDIGSGNGDFLFKVKESGGINSLGIDIDNKVVKIARGKYPDISFKIHNFEKSSLGGIGKFDFIVLEFVSVFIPDFMSLLRNLRAHLTDGGVVFVAILHPFFILNEASRAVGFPDDNYFVENVLKIKDMGVEENYFSRSISWYINLFSKLNYKVENMLEEQVSSLGLEKVSKHGRIGDIPEVALFTLVSLQ